MESTTALELRERQKEHYTRVLDILDRFYFYIDGSEMGTGKTFVSTAVALKLNLPTLVICPRSAKNTWSSVFKTYDVPVCDLEKTGGIMTYDMFRSKKGTQPKHGLLRRKEGKQVEFHGTTKLVQLMEQGIFVIFDECQSLKNKSAQHKAVKEFMKYLYEGNSRAAFLSGTVMDKFDHAVNFMRLVRFITSDKLSSNNFGRSLILKGIAEVQDWARKIDPEGAEVYLNKNPYKGKRGTDYVFYLFCAIIRPKIISIMPGLDLEKDIKNGYYRLSERDEQEYRKGLNLLSGATKFDIGSDQRKIRNDRKEDFWKALIAIQKSKMKAMVRVAREHLSETNEGCRKIVLFADYYCVLDYLLEHLAEYNPRELTGRMNEKKIKENVDLFQEETDECRVLIANPLVGGMAINLHDNTGLYPREVYIMPNYRPMVTHQAAYRVYRDGMVGTAKVRIFYGDGGEMEKNILDSVFQKGKVMKSVHLEQTAIFPNEYEMVKQ